VYPVTFNPDEMELIDDYRPIHDRIFEIQTSMLLVDVP